MANNIRINGVNVKSSVKIEVTFTHGIGSISIENISIEGIGGDPNATILSIEINSNALTINTRPILPRGYYKLTLSSTSSSMIEGARGESFLVDGATNVYYFTGPEDDNPIRDNILSDVPGVYDTDPGGLLFDSIDASASEIQTSNNRTGEVRSANYVSVTVEDELKTRGAGPFDRFANEGVYEIIRVGSVETGTTDSAEISFLEFPSDPVSLQQASITDEEVSNVSNDSNSFVGLLITLANKPIIKVSSIVLTRGNTDYEYNISQYKYGILENKYDSNNSYPALDIEENQIRLSTSAVGSSFPLPQGSDVITVSYLYKKVGRDVGDDSVSVTTLTNIVRESVPAVSTSFFLQNAPIVDESNSIPTTGGVLFLDPLVNFDPDENHPSFVNEIPFSISSFPSSVGEYTVNYKTGQVIVFGSNGSGFDGTTTIPPVATYTYRQTYQSGLDYTFSASLNEVASLPGRDLRGGPGTISFEYEDAFTEGTDFSFLSHVEVIDERVENRLIETIGVKTENNFVNEVFRIYNETTGEIYFPSRVSGNEVYFSASNPPRLNNITMEAAVFTTSIQSQIIVTDTLSVTGKSFVVFRIELENTKIASATSDFIGASFNSSLILSDADTFVSERYYDSGDSLDDNLIRLQSVGDYMVDYSSGLVYVAVNSGSGTDIGDATYKYGEVSTRNNHIVRVNDLYRSAGVNTDHSKIFTIGAISDSSIGISNLNEIGERTYDGSVLIVDNNGTNDTITVDNDIFKLRSIFQVTDLQTELIPINFATRAVVSSSNPNVITLSSLGVPVEDTYLTVALSGTRKYITCDRIQSLFDSGLAQVVSATSVIDSYSMVNYFSQGSDGYISAVENRVYLPSSTGALPGDIVNVIYNAKLNAGAAVLVDYSIGDIFVDYTYTPDEILISYEYGDNVLDWSISNSVAEGEEYFVSYKYGALRNSLRDNFGILSSVSEILTIPEELDRETYRNAITGTLQSFPKGPTIPSIEQLAEAFTQIIPNITEEFYQELILGRDKLYLSEMKLEANSDDELPTFSPGKFGNGLLLDKSGQTASLPANSNISLREGTWEAFVTNNWDGIENDATLTFNPLFEGYGDTSKVFIGSNSLNPTEIPFTLNKDDVSSLGRPNLLHQEIGHFIWYDTSSKKWRVRVRAPISEERLFSGTIGTSGEFNNVKIATTADGYDGYEGYEVNEINDVIRSTDASVKYAFIVDSYDSINMAFDSYDSYSGGGLAGFDGIDFTSDNLHYLLDVADNPTKNRLSLYKDGRGFLRFRVYDNNSRIKQVSYNVNSWEKSDTHHVGISWKMNTSEMQDEIHLFVDGEEAPNTYKYGGYLTPDDGTNFMDPASEILASSTTVPTIGGFDLQTTLGSSVVSSNSSIFTSELIGARFLILDDTDDGDATQESPYVFIKNVLSPTELSLEIGPVGSAIDYNAQATLSNVKFSANPLDVEMRLDPSVELIKLFSIDSYGEETELYSQNTNTPDYEFYEDGYKEKVNVYDGVGINDQLILRSYGLSSARVRQQAYIWADKTTNILRTIVPSPTSVDKVFITSIISQPTQISVGDFALVAMVVGVDIVPVLVGSVDFCQPSNETTGRTLKAMISGSNFDFNGVNQVSIIGNTTDGYGSETLVFNEVGSLVTSRFFTTITDIIVSLTPSDPTESVGSVEIREALPLTISENGGDAAEVHLSVQQQYGLDGYTTIGTGRLTDGYSRFGEEDIGKTINIVSPASIAGPYYIDDVLLDPSGVVKDSNTVVLDTTWSDAYTSVEWNMISTSYGDSGFANGLITLETADSGGDPFLLRSCWYEVDFPTYLTIPWNTTPDRLYVGSDYLGENQAKAVIDEMRILNELSLSTGRGESAPSSGRSITTDAQVVQEYTESINTLGLFHFNDSVENSANFYSKYDRSFRQSENSVNLNFGQSIVFNINKPLIVDNASIFQNNEGTIEFWISPILDTYNDPTRRYYIDLSPEVTATATVISNLTISLPVRARSISSVTIPNSNTNYFIGGGLSNNGQAITLGQALPSTLVTATVTYVPIANQGDRFSIYKDEVGNLVLYVSASGTDYQIRTPIHWKKNTWHRVFAGWNLNNSDNQDTLHFLVDGDEGGIIRYGTGLLYGAGNLYGQPTVWGSATLGTIASRNILSDINLTDTFNKINIGADFSGDLTALARMDNLRISSALRDITYLGGTGPGQLIGKDLLYTSNVNAALPVVEDAFTRLLLNFDTTEEEVEYLAKIRNSSSGIFDFYVEVIDTFDLADTDLIHSIITALYNRIKPAHTRAFVSFTE